MTIWWCALLVLSAFVLLLLVLVRSRRVSADLENQLRERTAEFEDQVQVLSEAQRDAEAANRAKSAFLADMSHELRTPLNSVVGFSNVLRKNKAENLTAKDLLYVDRILHNGKHLLRLINDILDLSKVEAGHMEVHLEAVDLEDLVRRVTGQFSAQLREKPVELLVEVPSPVAPLETDVGKLTQVLVNLIANALKFTQKGKVRVVVSVERESRRPVRIDVVDTGIGIPSEKLETIFEAFRQAEHRTSRDFGGTGLGLSISRALCQVLGYQLVVHSKPRREVAEGPTGSTFGIVLVQKPQEEINEPVRRRDTYQIRPLTDSALARTLTEVLAGRTVMVVADRSGVGEMIRDLGVGVVEAADAAVALDYLAQSPPDLLIFDVGGPQGDGVDELLKEHRSGLPMVALIDDIKTTSLPESVTRFPRSFEKSQLLTILWRLIIRRKQLDTSPVEEENLADES